MDASFGLNQTNFWHFLWLIIPAYLLGSISFGVFIAQRCGINIRKKGSGNIGASNVTRICGWRYGTLTLIFDAGKCALSTAAPLLLTSNMSLTCLCTFCCTLGHCFPVFKSGNKRFKGGKGVACTFGGLAVVSPIVASISALIWISIFFIWRVPTYASLAAAISFMVTAYYQSPNHAALSPVFTLTVFLFVLIVIRHWSNLKKILFIK